MMMISKHTQTPAAQDSESAKEIDERSTMRKERDYL